MNQIKGLSQILYLIIAASVLMIAALSMVFMLDEGLSGIADFGGDSSERGCQNAIETTCAALSDDAEIDIPSACTDTQGNTISPVPAGTSADEQILCSEY